jgi:predicted DCC family thiol-disulfide oxidoreductase YuxK
MSNVEELGDRLLVIFDGHCGLCNRCVRWFLARDRNDGLRFVPSDSPKVAGILPRHGVEPSTAAMDPNSILVAQDIDSPDERLLARSDAVLALLGRLPSPWPAIAVTLKLIPRPLRDLAYRLIARYRYRIWGRLESCPIPTADERKRFL